MISKMISKIKTFFIGDEEHIDTSECMFDKIEPGISVVYENVWNVFDKDNPPHDVVLAACDSYDCGWVMDVVWWSVNDKCWMLDSKYAHLPYTHWKNLPEPPNEDKWKNR